MGIEIIILVVLIFLGGFIGLGYFAKKKSNQNKNKDDGNDKSDLNPPRNYK